MSSVLLLTIVGGATTAPTGLPTLTVEFSPTTNPAADPVWVDISSYVRAASWEYGRQHELDRFEAGQATVVLDNIDRRFDVTYTGGPYYGNLKVLRRLRISATWGGVTYRLWSGFVESWPPFWPGRKDAIVTLKCVDGFKVLNLCKLNTSYPAQRTDVRIGAVLDSVGWPAADRDLRIGQTTVPAATLTGANALQHCQDVTLAEDGRFLINGHGYACFLDRHAPFLMASQSVAQGTFGDAAGELPYADLEPSYDDVLLYNEVRVTRLGGTTQTAVDIVSQARYYPRTYTLDSLLVGSDNEAADRANWTRAHLSEPGLRFVRLEVAPRNTPTLWPYVLGRQIGDRVTAKRRPPGNAEVLTQDAWIEGIAHERRADGDWRVTWRLRPADVARYWVLSDPVLSVLGTSTVAGY